jgi:hypothetical protein
MSTNGSTGPGPASPPIGPDEATTGQLVAGVTKNFSVLVTQQMELAKAELRESAQTGAQGGAGVVVALVLALYSVTFLSVAAAFGLDAIGLTLGWSFAIVGTVYLTSATIAGLVGVKRLKAIKPPRGGVTGLSKDIQIIGAEVKRGQAARAGGADAAPVLVSTTAATAATPAVNQG